MDLAGVLRECKVCKVAKPLIDFYAQKNGKHGKVALCIPCFKARRSVYTRRTDPDKLRVQNHQRYERRKERHHKETTAWRLRNPERAKLVRHLLYLKTKAHVRELSRFYRDKHRERLNKIDRLNRKTLRKTNPEKERLKCQLRRSQKKRAGGSYSAEDIRNLKREQRNKCACCRCSIKHLYEIDHIVALSRGGSNSIKNIQLMCPSCNRLKSNKDPIEFMQSQGYLL